MKILWQVGAFTNLRLVAVVSVSIVVQVAVHQIPALKALFQLQDISARQMFALFLLGLIPVSAIELSKLLRLVAPAAPSPASGPPVEATP